jgi:N6-L-threonylcarbamoyladenine synthase
VKTILALETSCDETAVAILRGRDDHSGPELLANEVASQIAEHEKYGGIVPEIASRNHLVYAPRLLNRTAKASRIDLSDVAAFAATSGPGLASSLMVGASIARDWRSALASLISRSTISKAICYRHFQWRKWRGESGRMFRLL